MKHSGIWYKHMDNVVSSQTEGIVVIRKVKLKPFIKWAYLRQCMG